MSISPTVNRKRQASRKRRTLRRKIARQRELGYCIQCAKLLWPTLKVAAERVEETKARADSRKTYLLDSYRCPHGEGWHVGHNYKLGLPISLCIGEMK